MAAYMKYPAHRRRPGKQKYRMNTKVRVYRTLTENEAKLLAPYMSLPLSLERAFDNHF